MSKSIQNCFYSVGRKKSSKCSVFLFKNFSTSEPQIYINNVNLNYYFSNNQEYVETVLAPLKKLNLDSYFNIRVKVEGGGIKGQADAIQLAISRSLCTFIPSKQLILKQNGFLKRDSRVKERKKYGLKKARKAPQYSKR